MINKPQEQETDRIILDDGEMFDGTREMFQDSFFSNSHDNVIIEWCERNEIKLIINGIKLVGY